MTTLEKLTKEKKIILFDGVCNLCNRSVNFIVDRDPEAQFLFAPLQSKIATDLLNELGEQEQTLNSIILIENGNIFRHSTAALRISKQLSSLWPLFYLFILLPKFLRDPIYIVIAKNRYKWFGKKSTCRLPTKELQSRFLDFN